MRARRSLCGLVTLRYLVADFFEKEEGRGGIYYRTGIRKDCLCGRFGNIRLGRTCRVGKVAVPWWTKAS